MIFSLALRVFNKNLKNFTDPHFMKIRCLLQFCTFFRLVIKWKLSEYCEKSYAFKKFAQKSYNFESSFDKKIKFFVTLWPQSCVIHLLFWSLFPAKNIFNWENKKKYYKFKSIIKNKRKNIHVLVFCCCRFSYQTFSLI